MGKGFFTNPGDGVPRFGGGFAVRETDIIGSMRGAVPRPYGFGVGVGKPAEMRRVGMLGRPGGY